MAALPVKLAASVLLALAAAICAWNAQASPATDEVLKHVRLPPGFKLEVLVDDVPGARSMALGDRGTLFVGTRGDKVYAVSGLDSPSPPTVHVIARRLIMPNGVAFRDGALYVAEISRILRYDGIERALTAPPQPKVVRDDFPKDRHHGWKYIAFGPDGKLYVPIGAPCNVCNEPRYASIMRMNPDGTGLEVFARGVRNTVGFTWHPKTQEFWFTDNGRDYLGEDVPPCELNVAPRSGLDFGFPYCHGKDIPDPQFASLGECRKMTPPALALDAHVAPLGVKFYTATAFPSEYHGQLLIAEHGSWNRKRKSGYRLMLVRLEGRTALSYEPFASGFHEGNKVFGRPVDLLVLQDGSILVSDDAAGAIYRIRYALH